MCKCSCLLFFSVLDVMIGLESRNLWLSYLKVLELSAQTMSEWLVFNHCKVFVYLCAGAVLAHEDQNWTTHGLQSWRYSQLSMNELLFIFFVFPTSCLSLPLSLFVPVCVMLHLCFRKHECRSRSEWYSSIWFSALRPVSLIWLITFVMLRLYCNCWGFCFNCKMWSCVKVKISHLNLFSFIFPSVFLYRCTPDL